MRCVVQRSGPAWVTVGGQRVGSIDRGLVVLAAFAPADTERELRWMAAKLPNLRLFADDDGKLNLSLREAGGSILLISQFTLYGDCRKGNRPSYVGSAGPEQAAALYQRFGALLREEWDAVAEGRFGAAMQVSLTNDGPVTVILDRDRLKPLTGATA
jgi:D-aminoacyl-tRNA deacylase